MADTDRLLLENSDLLQSEDGSGNLLIERAIPEGTLTLSGYAPTIAVTTSVRVTQTGDLVLQQGSGVRTTQVGDLVLQQGSGVRVTQAGVLVLWHVAPAVPPAGLISLIGQTPTVVLEDQQTNVRLTQTGDLVLQRGDGVRATQVGDLVLQQGEGVRATQVGDLVLQQGEGVRLTQAGVLVLYYTGPEFAPEIATSFGPLVWVEWTGPDGSLPVWAPVDLPDPSTYYRGFKEAKILVAGVVQRSLSDESGELQNQRFDVELDDSDLTLRTLLGQSDARRHLINTPLVMRMINDEDRRLLKRPRTVAIGVVREYRLS